MMVVLFSRQIMNTKCVFMLIACQSEAVSCLIYTSTYNVVFGGQEIVHGDESLPYLPLNKVCSLVIYW